MSKEKKKKFKIQAETVTYSYIVVEAKDKDEAHLIAENTDAGQFIPLENEGDFGILEGLTEEIK